MAKIVLEVDMSEWQYIKSTEHITLTEEELSKVLSELDSEDNPLSVTAGELIEYLDHKGERATLVALADSGQKMAYLIDAIGQHVACEGYPTECAGWEMLDSRGDITINCDRAFTKQ